MNDETDKKKALLMIKFLESHTIFVCERVDGPVVLECPIYIKGKQMPGQPFGCLRLPSHGGY